MSPALGAFLQPDGYEGPRGLVALSREGSVVAEGLRMVRRARTDRRRRTARPYAGPHRRAAVDPVLLVPGFMAGDWTLRAMSRFLRAESFRTFRSEIHVNVGCTREAADRLERRVEAIAMRRGRKVTVVGHSLGGMLARGLAARRPDLIDGIVTMGSPVLAPAAVHELLVFNVGVLNRLTRAGFGGLMAEDCTSGECARLSFEESQAPLDPDIAFTAIHSRRDGIVDWRACLDPLATHVEVTSSHCGMAVDPRVMDEVLRALRDAALVRASRQEAPDASGAVPLAARR
ncbi:alpha/beta fold hydrolase [Nocardioides terrisoli]|uniref:alpha/beta fold hydrolase n=1 Tax=Nocardioides terrisoli TaxID=3388267 RepID=UPI00287B5FD4|nr:alpha/beta fold hydrolase [Nocardioides marmorisolisilvae]